MLEASSLTLLTSPIHLSTYLPTIQPTYLPTYLPSYLLTYLPTYLPIYNRSPMSVQEGKEKMLA